jgi:glycosyltransferase involved in cell wall biosynthesis
MDKEPVTNYWVVIPAYNEAATVRDVAMRARRQCPNVIVVDDGSSDGTDKMLTGLDVIVLRNDQNCGKAGSLACGFDYALARGAVGVLTLDADGQHVPEEIPFFIQEARDRPNLFLVGARRHEQRRLSICRYAANRVADFWIGLASGKPIKDSQSGFRLYPARLLREVTIPYGREQSFVYESEILIEAARRGFAFGNVAVSVKPRSGPRPSHFRPVLDIARIVQMVAGKLLSRGMHPREPYRTFRLQRDPARDEANYYNREVAGRGRK